jgi:hypothetical protein
MDKPPMTLQLFAHEHGFHLPPFIYWIAVLSADPDLYSPSQLRDGGGIVIVEWSSPEVPSSSNVSPF